MNPFEQLLRAASAPAAATSGRALPRQAAAARASGTTITSHLLQLLQANGPMSTAEICDAAALTSRQVWGLLKTQRNYGRVTYDGRAWALASPAPSAGEEQAAALLRAKGWAVAAPGKEDRAV